MVTKDGSICDAMRWFSGMLLSFVTSNLVCKMITKESRMTRCVGFLGMLLSFGTNLQDGYKKSRNSDAMWWFSTVANKKVAPSGLG